jgi:hypothetical protein
MHQGDTNEAKALVVILKVKTSGKKPGEDSRLTCELITTPYQGVCN